MLFHLILPLFLQIEAKVLMMSALPKVKDLKVLNIHRTPIIDVVGNVMKFRLPSLLSNKSKKGSSQLTIL